MGLRDYLERQKEKRAKAKEESRRLQEIEAEAYIKAKRRKAKLRGRYKAEQEYERYKAEIKYSRKKRRKTKPGFLERVGKNIWEGANSPQQPRKKKVGDPFPTRSLYDPFKPTPKKKRTVKAKKKKTPRAKKKKRIIIEV